MDSAPSPQARARPPRRWKIRWRRCFAALLISLGLSEILLRAIFGLGHPLLYQPDPDCGYLPQPHQNIVRFFHRNTINDHSMRSPDFAPTPPPNSFRLLCIGDSLTYGTTYLSQDQLFTSRLASALPDILHSPVEVLNASAGGWAPANEWGFLKTRGTFHANLVLFIWNTPDIGQSFVPFKASPSMATQNPYTAIGETWSRYLKPRLLPGDAPPPDPGSTPATASDPAQVAANLQLLCDARDFAAAAGAKFGLIYVVSPAPGWQTPAFENDHAALLQWTAAHHIPLLDLSDAFRANGGMSLTFDGIHLKPEGHQLVTREIASHWNQWESATEK